MKHGYVGANDSELISKFKKENDRLIVTFLDGSSYETILTEDIEELLINRMINQAEKRNENKCRIIFSIEQEKTKFKYLSTIFSTMTFANMISALTASTPEIRELLLIMTALTMLGGTLSINEIRHCKEVLEEIKKYAIYLSKRKSIRIITNPFLYDGVKTKKELSINTLDDFSLSDLEKIEANIDLLYSYNLAFLKKN